MSLVAGFANQTARLEKRTGKDGFNKPVYSAPRTIRVRKEPAKGVTRSSAGTDVATESYYLTESPVAVEDRLDGFPVRRVKDVVSKGGKTIGFEVWI